jgi:class 3 adenylate cyclase
VSDHDIFGSEKELLTAAEELLQRLEGCDEEVFHGYTRLINGYRRLLRQIQTLTKLSDNQQHRLNTLLERTGKYVSPQVFRKITQGREMVQLNKTQRKRLTVFESDIKSFTPTTAHMEPEALSSFLNCYLEEMTGIIMKWNGTLDKYMGDAILVFFGDPEATSDQDHALRCVKMALEMRSRMSELQQQWYGMGFQEPLHIRMGVATGFCTVGNFGSSQRMDYTIIGNTVNLAQRLQASAETDCILISHDTWGLVREEVECDPPVSLTLKGFSHAILAHKVLRLRTHAPDAPVEISDADRNLLIRVDWSRITRDELLEIIRNL